MLSLLIIFAIAISLFIALRLYFYMQRKKTDKYLNKFAFDTRLNLYPVARQRLCLFSKGVHKKIPQAVLLLHGFTASPAEFNVLYPYLEAAGIPYYAPLRVGHGLGDLEILTDLKPSDWLRDAAFAFDLLAEIAEDISVIGHSTGGTVALQLAQIRDINHLILVGPNLVTGANSRSFHDMMQYRLMDWMLTKLVPVYPFQPEQGKQTIRNTSSVESALNAFQYQSLPTHSMKVMFDLCDATDLSKKIRSKDLTILYGELDKTVDDVAGLEKLDRHGITYEVFSYPRSAHNLLEDYDCNEAIKQIMHVLAA